MTVMRRTTLWTTTAVVVGVVVSVAAFAFTLRTDHPSVPGAAAPPIRSGPGRDLGAVIAYHERRVRAVPTDWQSWAALGTACVDQARVTGDPAYYPRAEAALARSVEIR